MVFPEDPVFVSGAGDVIVNVDSNETGEGDFVLVTRGEERGRVDNDGTGTGVFAPAVGGVTEITSDDESVTITSPTGPTVDLSVAGGGSPTTRCPVTVEDANAATEAPSTAATLSVGGLTFTAATLGVVGNMVEVITSDTDPDNPAISVDVTDNVITVTLVTESSVIVSSCAAVANAVNGDLEASALVSATATVPGIPAEAFDDVLADGVSFIALADLVVDAVLWEVQPFVPVEWDARAEAVFYIGADPVSLDAPVDLTTSDDEGSDSAAWSQAATANVIIRRRATNPVPLYVAISGRAGYPITEGEAVFYADVRTP